MSEFVRAENSRRSFRRPRKALAPLPPPTKVPAPDMSSLINRMLITKRDYEVPSSSVPQENSEAISKPEDDSMSVLAKLQAQINKIEFDSSQQQPQNNKETAKADFQEPLRRTQFNDLTSFNDSELANLAVPSDGSGFYRGASIRSSIQGVPNQKLDSEKVKQSRPIARTTSDTKKVDIVRKQMKAITAIKTSDNKKALDHQVMLSQTKTVLRTATY